MDSLPQIERRVDIPATPEEVWRRIVDGDLAQEWMGVRLQPRRGGDVTVPDRDVIGTVEDLTPGESITWSWREVDGDPSQVTIGLEPSEEGTLVTVTERLLEYEIVHTAPITLAKAA